jgi:stage III sporulation protein AH
MTDDAGLESDGGETTADYFATVQVNRQRARDESMEVLQSVIDSTDATETVKNEALSELSTIALEIEKEANIESLLVTKGFEDCVAVMNGNSISVVVKSQGDLQPAQIASINTVVYEQTGIEPLGVTIVHKN